LKNRSAAAAAARSRPPADRRGLPSWPDWPSPCAAAA